MVKFVRKIKIRKNKYSCKFSGSSIRLLWGAMLSKNSYTYLINSENDTSSISLVLFLFSLDIFGALSKVTEGKQNEQKIYDM